jgi:putative ABC transport system ATP-binding protein
MTEPLIELQNVRKVFRTEDVETHALSKISLTINKGEYLSIAGPSGCGKSTLLSIVGLLDTATDGEYSLAGHDVSSISKTERARIRNQEIGFIFQSFNLISDLNVEENVELPLTYRPNLGKNQRKQMVREVLEKVDVAHRAQHFPSQLSGGQQQRVAVARAIAGRPSVLLADEPTGNLDTKNAEAVMQLLDGLHAEGATICMVTHDARLALRPNRRIDVLDGRIISDKPLAETRSALPQLEKVSEGEAPA